MNAWNISTVCQKNSPLSWSCYKFVLEIKRILKKTSSKQSLAMWVKGCEDDGVDVSVGVDVGAVLGVGVHGKGVNLGVSPLRSGKGGALPFDHGVKLAVSLRILTQRGNRCPSLGKQVKDANVPLFHRSDHSMISINSHLCDRPNVSPKTNLSDVSHFLHASKSLGGHI